MLEALFWAHVQIQEAKTSSGECIHTRMASTTTGITNNSNQDGVLQSTNIVSLTRIKLKNKSYKKIVAFTARSSVYSTTITTKGWELKVQWADGTSSWLPLCEVKNANPVETAKYAITARIDQEPAFKWWVPRTLKKRHAIVAKVKSRYWRTTHKFSIELPQSVEEAYKLDEKNKNDFWHRAIQKEMARVRIAFE